MNDRKQMTPAEGERAATIDRLLAILPAEDRDRLVPLRAAPALVERLTGHRPHVAAIYRAVRDGLAGGVRLRTLGVGRTQYVTPRMLAEHWIAVGDARTAASAAPTAMHPRRPASRRAPARRRKAHVA